jgi:hypothetical protein
MPGGLFLRINSGYLCSATFNRLNIVQTGKQNHFSLLRQWEGYFSEVNTLLRNNLWPGYRTNSVQGLCTKMMLVN